MELTIIKTDHPHYAFVENLYLSAFPENERRPVDAQRRNVDTNPLFRCYLLTGDGGRPIGFITLWCPDGFYYAEHFAIDPSLRNGGWGSRVVRQLLRELELPVVLEAEVPADDLSRRRIAFYERQGFRIWDKDYVQPPYRPGGESLPLYLMVANETHGLPAVDSVRRIIYRHVYGVEE